MANISAASSSREEELKKVSAAALIRTLLPVVGLVVVFLVFNFLRINPEDSLCLACVYYG